MRPMTIRPQHITEDSIRPETGLIRDTHFLQTGTTIGRVLFREWAPLVVCGPGNYTFEHCMFEMRETRE